MTRAPRRIILLRRGNPNRRPVSGVRRGRAPSVRQPDGSPKTIDCTGIGGNLETQGWFDGRGHQFSDPPAVFWSPPLGALFVLPWPIGGPLLRRKLRAAHGGRFPDFSSPSPGHVQATWALGPNRSTTLLSPPAPPLGPATKSRLFESGPSPYVATPPGTYTPGLFNRVPRISRSHPCSPGRDSMRKSQRRRCWRVRVPFFRGPARRGCWSDGGVPRPSVIYSLNRVVLFLFRTDGARKR